LFSVDQFSVGVELAASSAARVSSPRFHQEAEVCEPRIKTVWPGGIWDFIAAAFLAAVAATGVVVHFHVRNGSPGRGVEIVRIPQNLSRDGKKIELHFGY